jgi:hypothetical protein
MSLQNLISHKLKKISLPDYAHLNKVSKKMTITDIDDQNILLATVQNKKTSYPLIARL